MTVKSITPDTTFAARARFINSPMPSSPLPGHEARVQNFERALNRYDLRLATWEREDNATAEARMLDARAYLFICAGFRPDGLLPLNGDMTSGYVRLYEKKVQEFTRALDGYELAVAAWSEQGTEESEGRILDCRALLFHCAGLG